ncbi:RTX toxin, partial [Rhizobium johnstonii]
ATPYLLVPPSIADEPEPRWKLSLDSPSNFGSTPTAPTKEFIGTNGNDILPQTGQSNGGNETFKGLGGSDVLKGGAGADVL